ncbi:MAG: UbiD family decarboxylase [Deltaproteobacteria bacterium]|nr:UbiD family decarboxylase [Deltaproteobacteria bacterium]
MPFADLREFLNFLDERKELIHIERKVSPVHEIAAYIRKTSDRQGPALLFDNVAGSEMRVAGGLFATKRHLLLALGASDHRSAVEKVVESIGSPIEPALVSRTASSEIVHRGSDVDLSRLPVVTHSSRDAGPFITMGLAVTKDPETGKRNIGLYRLQVKGRNRLGIMAQQLQIQLGRAEARGKGLPVAIALGVSPELLIASQWKAPYGVDELGLSGRLLGRPVELAKAVTVDLEVPAHAEIVIEGTVLPGEREIEGPFGEFSGYYQPASPKPVIEVTAITHRKNPIYLAGLTGMPTTDNHILKQIPIEATYSRALRERFPGVQGVHFPACGGAAYLLVVSLKKTREREPRNIIAVALGMVGPKYVVVVDDDVDIYDLEKVLWAVCTRSQPGQDTLLLTEINGAPLDPSAPEPLCTGGMGIDATLPKNRPFPEMVTIPGLENVPDF